MAVETTQARLRKDLTQRLRALVLAGEATGVAAMLHQLGDDERAVLKSWLPTSKRSFPPSFDDFMAGIDRDEETARRAAWQRFQQAPWVVALCAVELLAPAAAAERVSWGGLDFWHDHEVEALVVQALWDRQPEWVEAFAAAASRRTTGAGPAVAAVLRPAVVHHRLRCPDGPAFLDHWLAGTNRFVPLVDRLRDDPLMPDLLLGHLAMPSCGDDEGLVETVIQLCEEGAVERSAVLTRTLVVLTTAKRPRSARTLATIATGLGLRADEVPGGVDYCLGVMATAHASVVAMVLPLVLELVTTGDELIEVTRSAVTRPEKKSRTVLLKDLKRPERRGQVGDAALLECLDLLGDTEDVAFAEQVARVRAKLVPATANSTAESDGAVVPDAGVAPIGLWDLPPTPPPPVVWPIWVRGPAWEPLFGDDYWDDCVTPLVASTLAELAADTWDVGPLRATVADLVARERLKAGRLVPALEPIFLSGGLRAMWGTALELVDVALTQPRLPSGMADLLRLLNRYAPEVPAPFEVGPALQLLAQAPQASKARAEARRLLEHARTPVPAAAAGTPPSAGVSVPPPRGLWVHDTNGDWDPMARPLPRAPFDVVDVLTAERHATTHYPAGVQQDLSLTGVVQLVRDRGAAEARRTVEEVKYTFHGGPVLQDWCDGLLDLDTFWRVGSTPVMSWWTARERLAGDASERINPRRRFPEVLAAGPDPLLGAVVPSGDLGEPVFRLAYLHGAELLLRAEELVEVLSTPTSRDGTLDVGEFLARLRRTSQARAEVGPLDLVVALHRVGPCDPARAEEVPDGLVTDPRFTTRDGVGGRWDASAMARGWFAAGGLPAAHLDVAPDGLWRTDVRAPVPYDSLPAVAGLDVHGSAWGAASGWSRMSPFWADRFHQMEPFSEGRGTAVQRGTSTRAFRGLAWHDALLNHVAGGRESDWSPAAVALADVARRRMIDAGLLARAARARHEAGTLALTKVVSSCRDAGQMPGALPGLWGPLLTMTEALLEVPRRPSTLAALVRVLVEVAPDVPPDEAEPTPGLLDLARSKGKGRLQEEARTLVAILEVVARRSAATGESTP